MVTKRDAREAVARTGLVVDAFDGEEPSLADLFLACEVSGIDPPPELLEFISDDTLRAFGYDL